MFVNVSRNCRILDWLVTKSLLKNPFDIDLLFYTTYFQNQNKERRSMSFSPSFRMIFTALVLLFCNFGDSSETTVFPDHFVATKSFTKSNNRRTVQKIPGFSQWSTKGIHLKTPNFIYGVFFQPMTSRDKFLVCHTLLKIIVRMVGSITLSIGISLLVIQISKQSHQSHEYVSLLILVHNSRLDLLSIQNTKIK